MERDDREVAYTSFVAARSRSLLRLAYLVTGDEAAARRLLDTALAWTWVDWARIGGRDRAEQYARRRLLSEHRAASPRSREPQSGSYLDDGSRENTGDAGEQLAVRAGESPDPSEGRDRRDVWRAFSEIPPRERALLVLAVDEGLADDDIGRLVGARASVVRVELQRGWTAWTRAMQQRRDLPAPRLAEDAMVVPGEVRPEGVAELRAEIAKHADDVRPEAELAARAQHLATSVRARRRRRSLIAAAGVALVVGLTAVLSWTPGLHGDAAGGIDPSSSPTPAPSSIPPVVPDALLGLARSDQALLGFGPAVVDGGLADIVVVDADPPNGALHGLRVEALARTATGYVVRLGALRDDGADVANPRLSYVDRHGTAVDLGRVSVREPDFSVSADGREVVHVIRGPVNSENEVAQGHSELVVQNLGAGVSNRTVVRGPVRPLGLDADRVWFERLRADGSGRGLPFVWDRLDSSVRRMAGRAGWVAQDLNGEFMVVRDERGCLHGLEVHDPFAPRKLWRRCVIGQGTRISPAADFVSTVAMGSDAPALVTLDARTGHVVDRVQVAPGAVEQTEWTSAGGVVLAIGRGRIGRAPAFDARDVVYTAVQRSGPVGGSLLIARTITGLRVPLVLGRELPLPPVG